MWVIVSNSASVQKELKKNLHICFVIGWNKNVWWFAYFKASFTWNQLAATIGSTTLIIAKDPYQKGYLMWPIEVNLYKTTNSEVRRVYALVLYFILFQV